MLILKYIIPQYDGYIYYGGANVGMNAGIMISYVSLARPAASRSSLCTTPSGSQLTCSAMVLWVAQSGSDEFEYQLTV